MIDLVEDALHGHLPEAAVAFFVAFSRFECAMKRLGTYAKGNDAGVEADWDKLAHDLGKAFFDQVVAAEIAAVLIDRPPKKQIKLHDGKLGWRNMGPVSNVQDLFVAIRRARNNLIHGGKYQDGGAGAPELVDGVERDEALLRGSMAVLGAALDARHDLRSGYFKF